MVASAAASTQWVLYGSAFSLGAGGVITYTGPTITVLVTITCGYNVGTSRGFVSIACSHNGDIIGEASGTNINLVRAGYSLSAVVDGTGVCGPMSAVRRVTLNNGDTLQPTVGVEHTVVLGTDFIAYSYTMTVRPMSA